MTTSSKSERISLANRIAVNLAFRQTADDLFNYIDSLEASKIVVDFSGVANITPSFAHQYMLNKIRTEKDITEVNMNPHIRQMFELVRSRKTQQKRNTKTPEVLEVTY